MHLGGRAEAVDGDQHASIGEQLAQRRRFGFVQLQPAGNCLGRVVGAAPIQHPPRDDVIRHIEVDRPVHRVRRQQGEQPVGLRFGSRKAVQQKAGGGIGRFEALGHDPQDQIVADKLARVHHLFGLAAQRGAIGHRGTQHVARGDMRDAIALDQQLALRALAGSLLAQDDQPSDGGIGHQARKPS